jgi:hypothetical protein
MRTDLLPFSVEIADNIIVIDSDVPGLVRNYRIPQIKDLTICGQLNESS